MLPDLQEQVLLKLLKLGTDKSVNDIQKSLSLERKKEVSFGSIFTTLDRLGSKKLVTWTKGPQNNVKGGRAPRLYKITIEGKRILAESLNDRSRKYSEISADGILAGLISKM